MNGKDFDERFGLQSIICLEVVTLRMRLLLWTVFSLMLQSVCGIPRMMSEGPELKTDLFNEDEWEPVYRIYSRNNWNSHDDYLSAERTARDGDEDDSQFRSHKMERWDDYKIRKVKLEIFHDGDEVAEFEFDGTKLNSTGFFNPRSLIHTSYDDIPDGRSNIPFPGDDFSIDGDDDSRHWTVSSRHVGDCMNDEGWFQVIDKPKPGRNRCVCGYENVDEYPAIMYSKGKRKTKWSDKRNVGYADMMQVSVSHKPYTPPQQPQMFQNIQPPQQIRTIIQTAPQQPPNVWFET